MIQGFNCGKPNRFYQKVRTGLTCLLKPIRNEVLKKNQIQVLFNF